MFFIVAAEFYKVNNTATKLWQIWPPSILVNINMATLHIS